MRRAVPRSGFAGRKGFRDGADAVDANLTPRGRFLATGNVQHRARRLVICAVVALSPGPADAARAKAATSSSRVDSRRFARHEDDAPGTSRRRARGQISSFRCFQQATRARSTSAMGWAGFCTLDAARVRAQVPQRLLRRCPRFGIRRGSTFGAAVGEAVWCFSCARSWVYFRVWGNMVRSVWSRQWDATGHFLLLNADSFVVLRINSSF